MNKKTRLILAIVLALLLIAYILLRLNAPEEKTRRIFALDTQKIDKIEIWDSEDKIEMELIEGIWKIKEPFVWNADSTRIAGFFEHVLEAKYAHKAMSVGKDAASRYKLKDEDALHIRVSAGRKSAYALFSNMGNPWDYFRYASGSDVFQVKSKVVQRYHPQPINWRSPLIFQYWEEELATIRAKYADNDYTLSREGLNWTYRDSNQNFSVAFDNFSLVKIISVLQNMQIYIFADGREPYYREAFAQPLCEVWITDTEGKTRKLSFAKVDNERHMLMVDDDYNVLYQVSFDIVFRFMRNAELFRRG